MSASSITSGLPAPCEHKSTTGCMLSALPCCCSCADKRPQATAYPVYIDGEGMRMKGRRWQRYCRRCRDFWQSRIEASEAPGIPTTTTSPDSPAIPTTTDMVRSSGFGNARLSGAENLPYRLGDNPFHPSNMAEPYRAQYLQRDQTPSAHHTHPEPRRRREQVFALGTVEDVQRDDYISPLAGMFGRAYDRYRAAEENRQAARQMTDNEPESFDNGQQSQSSTTAQARTQVSGTMGSVIDRLQDNFIINSPLEQQQQHYREQSIRRWNDPGSFSSPDDSDSLQRRLSSSRPSRGGRHNFHWQFHSNPLERPMAPASERAIRRFATNVSSESDDILQLTNPIDLQTRPKPVTAADLKVDFTCKVCCEQKINTLCFPCMHAAMCQWCAEIYRSDCRNALTERFDVKLWKCPMCRAQIKEVKRFYI